MKNVLIDITKVYHINVFFIVQQQRLVMVHVQVKRVVQVNVPVVVQFVVPMVKTMTQNV